MKRFLLIISAILSLATLQAQVATNDTVTISHFANNTRSYLEASANGLHLTTKVNDNCLWIVTKSGNNYSFKTVATPTKYLFVYAERSGWGYSATLQLGSNESTFAISNASSGNGYTSGKLYYSYKRSNRPYNFYLTVSNGSWAAEQNNDPQIDIEKWTNNTIQTVVGYFNPAKCEFTYAQDESAAQQQAQNVRFVFDLRDSTYMQCVNRPEEGKLKTQITTIPDLNTLETTYDITPTFKWESNTDNSTNSVLKAANYSASETSNGTSLLQYSGGTEISEDKLAYELTITPDGASPMGLKKQYENNMELWVDYVDRLVATCTYKDKTYTSTMRVVREAYHRKDFPEFEFTISPQTYTFKKEVGSREFAISAIHQHGSALYNVGEQILPETLNYTYGPDTIDLTSTEDNWDVSLSGAPDWLTATSLNQEGKTTITAEANTTGNYRSATITATVTPLNTSEHRHTGTASIVIAQRSEEAKTAFSHRKKYPESEEALTPQKVHQVEKTIYHLPGEEVELRLPESNFYGYMRWYDTKTNGDPQYNDPNVSPATTWRTEPAGSGGVFWDLNTQSGESYGLYAINGKSLGSSQNTNNTPIIYGWSDGQSHTIACDVSAYTDYTIEPNNATNNGQVTKVVEPTLSYRQLFHLKPATDMAEKMHSVSHNSDKCQGVENYHYIAPIKQDILLTTEHRYHNYQHHISEMCYFYYTDYASKKLARVDESFNVTWYVYDGEVDLDEPRSQYTFNEFIPQYTAEKDFVVVTADVPCTKTYQLRVEKDKNTGKNLQHDLYIAQFVVEYVDHNTYGPTTNTIISEEEIKNNFTILKEINFNYNKPSSTNTQYHDQPLDWEQSTYGFTYPTGHTPTYVRPVNGEFPFYGEYCFINKISDKSWLQNIENHGGAANGYAMYVDGTMEPGLVVSLYTDKVICSGQTLYCSAWFCNPLKASDNTRANPIFRCNIQGQREGENTWEDVSVFFVGELTNRQGWNQIVFPITSAHSYAKTRISIYNFATTNNGNDFLIDDICLFVSPLPMAAYHAKMACRTMENNKTSAAAVLRLDYNNMHIEGDNGYIYYQLYQLDDQSNGKAIALKEPSTTNPEGYESAYLHEDLSAAHQSALYGSVQIPQAGYDPETAQQPIYGSVSALLDYLVANNMRQGKGYVKTYNNGEEKWLLYVAHIIPNADDEHTEENVYLNEEHDYVIRMAYTPDELDEAACNMQAPLRTTHQTIFDLKNAKGEVVAPEEFHKESLDNCPNEMYTLIPSVKNQFASQTGGDPNITLKGPILADWLVGFKEDDSYGSDSPTPEQKAAADAAFLEKYKKSDDEKYTRGQIATAILYDMRRVPTANDPNPNYYATSLGELQPEAFLSERNYEMIKHLCEAGLLQLAKDSRTFYLAPGGVVRYWVYPIDGTAIVKYDDQDVVLHDCPEPNWVRVSAFTHSSIPKVSIMPTFDEHIMEDMKTIYTTMLPDVRVLQKNVNTSFTIPVTEMMGTGITLSPAAIQSTNDENFKDIQSYSLPCTMVNNVITVTPNANVPEFKIGKEYRLRIPFSDNNDSGDAQCADGTIYFNLVVVPDQVVWSPKTSSFNGWGLDENWKGWDDKDTDGVVDDDEIMSVGFVPIAGSDVIIPTLTNTLLYPYITDHNHYPNVVHHHPSTCNYIYFAPGAKIHNQHLLQYTKAFVDMQMTAGSWHLVSAPLQGMVSGDMFIPHNGRWSSSTNNLVAEPNPFEVSEFQGIRHADAAYAFWEAFHESDVKGSNTLVRNFSNMKFTQSNSLIQSLNVGTGYMVYGLGYEDGEQLTVRLPKPDTEYYYYNEGKKDESFVEIPQENRGKLAYKVESNSEEMSITLQKQANSDYVVFGNPTMAYIDLLALYNDNKAKGWTGEYTYVQHSATAARTPILNTPDRYLPPMTSVLLTTNEATELTINLKPEHLTLNTEVDRSMNGETPSQLAARRAPVSDNATSELMTINAFTEKAFASMILATNPAANDYYTSGEDALFTSTGVENESYVTTPLNMYTVAEQVPMMADVRQGISQIPLAILAADNARAEHMQLAFYLSSNWSRECYFCDSITGQKIRIMDGLVITVEMPQNHEQRYYIEGPDEYIGSNDNQGGGVTTSTSILTPMDKLSLNAFSVNSGELVVTASTLMREVKIYDMTGRLIADKVLDLFHNTTSLAAPSGICIVEAILRDCTALHTQTIVR